MKHKNLLKLVGAIVLALVISIAFLPGCAKEAPAPAPAPAPAEEQSVFTLRVQHCFGVPEHEAYIRPMLTNIEEASRGRIKFEVFLVNDLVPYEQEVQACMAGTVDIVNGVGSHAAVPLDIAPLDASPPFGWNSAMELVTLWYKRGMREIFIEAYEEMGSIKWIGIMPTDPTHVITNKPIHHFEDLKGLKLDAMANIANILDETAGTTSVALPREELYLSGQTGVIDGIVDMGATEAHASSFNEVFPYFLDNPVNGAWLVWWLINEDTWNSLPDDLQGLITTGLKAGAFDTLLHYYVGEAENRQYFTVTHMPGEEWNQLRTATISKWDEYAKVSPRMAKLVQIIRDYSAEVETVKWWR